MLETHELVGECQQIDYPIEVSDNARIPIVDLAYPYHHFLQFLRDQLALRSSRSGTTTNFITGHSDGGRRISGLTMTSDATQLTWSDSDEISGARLNLLVFLDLRRYIHPIFFDARPFLPSPPTFILDMQPDTTFALTESKPYLEIFKLLVLAMSNNFATKGTINALLELTRKKSVLSVLASLLNQNLISMKACAERLWLPAVLDNQVMLVKVLIILVLMLI